MTKIKSLAPDGSYSCGDQSINAYSQTGQELKEQFLREARALLKQTSQFLAQVGWTECDIRVNPAGMAVSGDVSCRFLESRRSSQHRLLHHRRVGRFVWGTQGRGHYYGS